MSVAFLSHKFSSIHWLKYVVYGLSILILLDLWGIAISWISPLVRVFFLELLLDLISLLHKSVEKINIVQIRVQILLRNLKLLEKVRSKIVFGYLWERETLLHLGVSVDFDLVKLFLGHFIVLGKVLFKGDSSIKIGFGEWLRELQESVFQTGFLLLKFLRFLLSGLLWESLFLFIFVGNAIDVFGHDIGSLENWVVDLSFFSIFIQLHQRTLLA